MTTDWEHGTQTCDFWVGVFQDEYAFSEYVGEDPRYYELRDTPDEIPLSRFIRDQGQTWFDHDLIEMGFKADAQTVAELVEGYSYADQYAEELSVRVRQAGLSGVNGFLFIRGGEIERPRSIKTEDIDFRYVGQITYRI
jgi:hypothetical protein